MLEPIVDLHLSDEQLAAIGLVAARWSFLETEITFTASALGSLVENNQRLPTTFKRIVQQWRKHARRHLGVGKEFTYYEQLIDAVLVAYNARNSLLHGRVYGDSTGAISDVFVDEQRHLEEWVTTPRDFPLPWFKDHSEAVKDLTVRIITFNRQHFPISPYTLPKTRR